MTIDYQDLANVDLNLLVALDALLTERSVTRAAAHVGIGQSAMSGSLARLRKLLGDDLLTRVPEGMVLTPRAAKLIEPVRSALRQFQTIVLREDAFDPATAERVFTLAAPGSVEMLLGPRLLETLQREAPGIRLSFRALEYGTVLKDLDTDQIDLAVGLITSGQFQHKIRPLYRFDYCCLFNPDLLGVTSPLSLDDFLRFPHIMTSMTGTGTGVVDDALAKIGRSRRLAATTPRFTTVPFMVKASPIIATMVSAVARSFAEQLDLAISPVPVEIDDFAISMLWHASYDQDPAHLWFRDVLLRIGRDHAKTLRPGG